MVVLVGRRAATNDDDEEKTSALDTHIWMSVLQYDVFSSVCLSVHEGVQRRKEK
jgi:hypothetical protein